MENMVRITELASQLNRSIDALSTGWNDTTQDDSDDLASMTLDDAQELIDLLRHQRDIARLRVKLIGEDN